MSSIMDNNNTTTENTHIHTEDNNTTTKNIHTVLSFDVGIKNLAYCLLSIDNDKQTFDILDWDVINLADNRNTCSFIKRNREKCTLIAKYVTKINGCEQSYYCKAHSTKASILTRDIQINSDITTNITKCLMCKNNGSYVCDVIEGTYCKTHLRSVLNKHNYICHANKCKNIINKCVRYSDIKHNDDNNEYNKYNECVVCIGWCNDHYDEWYPKYISKNIRKISQHCNKLSLTTIATSMFDKLDMLPQLLRVDEVLIENQPTLINPTMKTVSAMLYSYFVMRGIHEKDKTMSTIDTIRFIAPSNKIKVGGTTAENIVDNANDRVTYKITKSLCKKICRTLIDGNDRYINLYNTHKKKDDLADAFLQGLIISFPVIPEHYESIIKTLFNDNLDDP